MSDLRLVETPDMNDQPLAVGDWVKSDEDGGEFTTPTVRRQRLKVVTNEGEDAK